jgi:hypothetical protein
MARARVCLNIKSIWPHSLGLLPVKVKLCPPPVTSGNSIHNSQRRARRDLTNSGTLVNSDSRFSFPRTNM